MSLPHYGLASYFGCFLLANTERKKDPSGKEIGVGFDSELIVKRSGAKILRERSKK